MGLTGPCAVFVATENIATERVSCYHRDTNSNKKANLPHGATGDAVRLLLQDGTLVRSVIVLAIFVPIFLPGHRFLVLIELLRGRAVATPRARQVARAAALAEVCAGVATRAGGDSGGSVGGRAGRVGLDGAEVGEDVALGQEVLQSGLGLRHALLFEDL